ncbi:MAG: hypothetical protein A3I11_06195 [Elusimicrobia bacterium RIFCSPLOWO2_02_FULL_39_32]|nr:MAG: hypothetical protein A3B80_04730 [Elusimicrobia bacterium RIFCSPHIGHO2_02_FULL_39_36]OGR91661.1 MAG: hypothetical protein A3I11_06195 [Elusimicrobia bacterium RIFCSPLOWO2_02_FULL_39_32]
MNFSFSSLVASLMVSGVGFVFFKVGRKKMKPLFLIFGIVMMVYPYFITNFLWMVGIAIGLSSILYWLSKMGY